ncbi:hypothetical protein ES707_08290 [subsurface metagenome]
MPLETLSDFSLRTHNTGITILPEPSPMAALATERVSPYLLRDRTSLACPFSSTFPTTSTFFIPSFSCSMGVMT